MPLVPDNTLRTALETARRPQYSLLSHYCLVLAIATGSHWQQKRILKSAIPAPKGRTALPPRHLQYCQLTLFDSLSSSPLSLEMSNILVPYRGLSAICTSQESQ